MKLAAAVPIICVLAACGDNIGGNVYAWDERRTLCSAPLDDYETVPNWKSVDRHMNDAEQGNWAVLYHMHTPGVTVSMATIEHVLDLADAHHLKYVTYSELLETAPHVGALALSFDDNAPDAWITTLDLFAQRGVHVTYFVAYFDQTTPEGRAEIASLAAAGHDIEPHTINHFYGVEYVAANGMQAYLDDEVLPSFQLLQDAGYPTPAAFAYPFGEHTEQMDAALEPYVNVTRSTMDPCFLVSESN